MLIVMLDIFRSEMLPILRSRRNTPKITILYENSLGLVNFNAELVKITIVNPSSDETSLLAKVPRYTEVQENELENIVKLLRGKCRP